MNTCYNMKKKTLDAMYALQKIKDNIEFNMSTKKKQAYRSYKKIFNHYEFLFFILF